MLFGGLGDDTLEGGAGADTFYGGEGSNLFIFTAKPQSMVDFPYSSESINGFKKGNDKIDLSRIDAIWWNDQFDRLQFQGCLCVIDLTAAGADPWTLAPGIWTDTKGQVVVRYEVEKGDIESSFKVVNGIKVPKYDIPNQYGILVTNFKGDPLQLEENDFILYGEASKPLHP